MHIGAEDNSLEAQCEYSVVVQASETNLKEAKGTTKILTPYQPNFLNHHIVEAPFSIFSA